MNKFNEDRMRVVRDFLYCAQQAGSMRQGDALVARAANVLQGVVRRESEDSKVIYLSEGFMRNPNVY